MLCSLRELILSLVSFDRNAPTRVQPTHTFESHTSQAASNPTVRHHHYPPSASPSIRSAFEAGHREVGVVSWPGKIKSAVTSHVLASSLDYVPTILHLAGIELPADRTFDGKDLGSVLFADDPAAIGPAGHHKELFISWNGQAYIDGSAGATGLFEKIRLPGLSAMFKIGYGAQCCRGANGDANTPYNSTCSSHGGALAPSPTWLAVPLLFNLTIDVAESNPLEPGSDAHTAAWARVNESQAVMLASLRADRISTVLDRQVGKKLCCNPANVVCRCEEE